VAGSILWFKRQVLPLCNPATFQQTHYAQSKIVFSSFSFLQTKSAHLLCFKHHPGAKTENTIILFRRQFQPQKEGILSRLFEK
jgi:hypothetical protein